VLTLTTLRDLGIKRPSHIGHDVILQVCLSQRLPNIRIASRVRGINVGSQSSLEKLGILRDDRDDAPQIVQTDSGYVDTVNDDFTGVRL
jgi:hypothetical protein